MKNWTERIGIVVAAGVLSMVLNAPPGETQQVSPRAGAVPAGGIIFTRTVFTTTLPDIRILGTWMEAATIRAVARERPADPDGCRRLANHAMQRLRFTDRPCRRSKL